MRARLLTLGRLATVLGCVTAAPLSAKDAWSCLGVLPSWQLDLSQTQGVLTTNKTLNMPVMNITRAEGRDWPQAFTLVGDWDTAIVIVTPRACQLNESTYDTHVQVLTQQDEQPILLDGCCLAVVEE